MAARYIIPEPAPDARKPSLLIYSSCHAYGILRYLNEFRPEVRSKYNVSAVIIHLAAEIGGAFQDPDLLKLFKSADFLIHHPLASDKWAGSRSDELGARPDCVKVAMESPHFNSMWPFHSATYESELPVRNMIKSGAEESDIIRAFDSGQMECLFDLRFQKDVESERARDAKSELKYMDFIENNFRGTKLFFTPNHPTMPLVAHMMDQFLEKIGHPKMGVEHALSLPLRTMDGDNHYPETAYEFDYYRLWYPKKYEHNMGGKKFYHSEIARICEA